MRGDFSLTVERSSFIASGVVVVVVIIMGNSNCAFCTLCDDWDTSFGDVTDGEVNAIVDAKFSTISNISTIEVKYP
jgi:hypothetical protein